MDEDELIRAIEVLNAIDDDRGLLAKLSDEERVRFQKLCGKLAAPDIQGRRKLVRALRKKRKAERRQRDEDARERTGIRELRAAPVLQRALQLPPALDVDEGERLEDERKCYVCKRAYNTLHAFYDQLCGECGDLNFKKRTPRADLTGRSALVTGARVKIGYYAALMLLRSGCEVIALTRFPKDAAERYRREPDFSSFEARLSIYGVDLRHTPSVQSFAAHLCQARETLDFVIHNACQTVRRPPNFYAHMLEAERAPVSGDAQKLLEAHLDSAHARADSAELTQVESSADLLLPDAGKGALDIFPAGALDQDLQQIDLRAHNSWRLTHGEVPTLELLEVLLVNAVAPFVLSAKLKPLLINAPTFDRHIVNVSAVEGQFYRAHKTDKHPHTNMAKAALNMLTRTSAATWLAHGVHMNAVDTGWVTDEDPVHLAEQKVKEHRFSPPLDVIDGAARIVDPIYAGLLSGEHAHGKFFKDYAETPW